MTRNPDILFITEYIKNVLYFATVRPGKALISTSEFHYFCIDNELVYENYYSDFGPLNLGCVYKYCKILSEKLKQHSNKQTIVHYTSSDPKKKSNAAFLLGCYGVLYLSLTPRDALKPLVKHGQNFRPFQDATQGDPIYTISVIDCLYAIKKASQLALFNFQDFDYEEYERLDKIQGGDLNWIIPGKFLAFIGPVDYSISLFHPPEMYIDYFKENNVTIVIRLNKRMYDGDVFNNAGITHYDLFFADGSCPPRHILMKFLQIAEEANGAIAVHCKAGLGRTGSLIGCYLIKHYRMTAHEAIGWMRICRPGSVIGHQQGWLEHLESWLLKQGNLYRKRMFQDPDKLPVHEFGVYSISEKMKRRTVLNKPSSPPPTQWKTRSDSVSPPARPQAARIREAASKTKATEQYDWHLRYNNSKMITRGSQHESSSQVTQRTSGAGEPRITPMRPSNSGRSAKRSTPQESATPIPTFRTSQGSVIKTLTDAKDFLIKSSLYTQQKERERSLNSSVLVTPFRPTRNELPSARLSNYNAPYNANRGPNGPIQGPVQRRRLPLGRSPSPSPSSSPTRATNTTPIDRFFPKDRITLREALSNLKVSGPRAGGSIGAASVGASSLGACRDAPPGKRAPSVRSDERPLATQGDILNSIKFQRRFRDCLSVEKKPMINERSRNLVLPNAYASRLSMSKELKPSNRVDLHTDTSRGNNFWRSASPSRYTSPYTSQWARSSYLGESRQPSATKDKPPLSPARGPSPPARPTSPKGRARNTSFF